MKQLTKCISFAFVFLLSGCQQETAILVSGKITLDGEPLSTATVTFLADGHEDAAVFRTDEKGVYPADASIRQPLQPGKYTVRISTSDEGDMEADPPLPPVKERVPSKYNFDSTLTASVDANNLVFDFDLDSKGRMD